MPKVYPSAPYFDDFDPTKNYLRVLFRPGYAVQARELTQLQTAIQAQIERFGQNIFKDGGAVVGGQATLDTQYSYVKLYSTFTYHVADDPSNGSNPITGTFPDGTALIPDNYASSLIGTTITGRTSGVTANVVNVTSAGSGDPLTVYVKYTSSGTNNTYTTFAPGEYLVSNGSPERLVQVKQLLSIDTVNGDTSPCGYGTNVSVTGGAFFVSGNFIYAEPQSIILSKYTTTPSGQVVYVVNEAIVSSADDNTLTDNALGSPNVAAPGANRYQITLTLGVQPLLESARTQANIIQLMVVNNGYQVSPVTSQYSLLDDTLAQRTFEEAGNYTVNPFLLNIREYLNTGTNGGLYTTAQIIAAGNATDTTTATAFGEPKLAVGIEKSVAYVDGYRIELVDTKYITMNKARDESYVHDVSTVMNVQNYVQVNTLVGLPDINTFLPITLKDVGGTARGTARARGFTYVSGTGSSAIYNLYLFDISMNAGHSFSEVTTVYCSYGSGAAFSASLVTLAAPPGGPNSLIFPLPRSAIQTLRAPGNVNNNLYQVSKRYDAVVTDGSGSVTINAAGGLNETFYSTTTADYIVVKSDGTLINTSAYTITLGGGGSSVTFALGGGYATTTLYIVAPSRRNALEKTKTLHVGATTTIGSPNTTPGLYDSLPISDLIEVTSVTQSGIDITNRYYVDNGQRDNFYDVARLQLIPGATPPSGAIVITYNYFSHGSGDYFSVDSYPLSSSFTYEDIPSFQSSQGLVQLRDSLDFRPTKDNTSADYTSTGSSLVGAVLPESLFTGDIQYYLPKIDKIYVDKKGNFGVAEGISADKPQAPNDPDSSMILYTVTLPAYTFSTGDVSPVMIDNRRYTMRDIGSIDNRLKNVEYYTALSLVENNTQATQILDVGTGTPYFQHGFVVDAFSGSQTGDAGNVDWACSIDRLNGVCRPQFYEDNVKLVYNAGLSSGVTKTGSLITLSYYETDQVIQPYASETTFVNPFNVFNYTGSLQLSPSSDEWKETEQIPDVVVDNNGIYDSLVNAQDPNTAIGTVWNEWQTNWTGVVNGQTTSSSSTTSIAGTVSTQTYGNLVVDVSYVPFIRSRIIFFYGSGLKPNTRVYPFFDSTDVSSYVTQLTVVGSKASYWQALQYFNQTTVVDYSGLTGFPTSVTIDGVLYTSGSTNLVTDSAGDVFGAFIIPNNSSLSFKTGTRIFKLTDSSTNNVVLTNTSAQAPYVAQGLLDTVTNLVVSTEVPTVSTSSVNTSQVVQQSAPTTISPQPPTTVAPTPNPAPSPGDSIPSGFFNPSTEPITDAQGNYVQGPDWLTGGVTYMDPLAQTFLIDTQGGVMATGIDVYFAAVDSSLPITLSLVTVQNGTPTQTNIPFSKVTLPAASTASSVDASVATTFKFVSPVQLLQGVQYAFVLTTNSNVYKVWTATLGSYDTINTSYRINVQPNVGVLFESQNSSTWTPNQTQAMKFTLRRAAFNQGGGYVTFNDVAPAPRLLEVDPLLTTNASGSITVFHPGHGNLVGANVTISGVVSNGGGTLNGIALSQINTTQTITYVDANTYSFTVGSGTASATGRAGGSAVYATENELMDVFQPVVQDIVTPDTNILWTAKYTTGKSLAGAETPFVVASSYVPVVVNANNFMKNPQIIASAPNITLLSDHGAHSFYLKAVLSTTRNNESPVIDLNRLSLITINNLIDNPTNSGSPPTGENYVTGFTAETAAVGGSALARYLTKQITLTNPAERLSIFLSVNRPTGSSVAVYFKIPNPSAVDAPYDSLPWILATPDTTIPITDDPTIYNDITYTITESDVGNAAFGFFAVKVVLYSSNSSEVPTIKDFRAIALS